MYLQNLAIFDTVMQEGSFAGAARRLSLDPSSVSRAIAALEHDLGARLFERSTRRLVPTEAGQTYHRSVSDLLARLQSAREAARDAAGAIAGEVRLGTSISFGKTFVVPLIPAFRAAQPQIALDIVLDDGVQDLVKDRIDLAIRLGPCIDSGDLIVRRLMQTRYRVCASPAWLAEHGPLPQPKELAAHDCVLLAMPGFRSAWTFRDRGGVEIEVPVRSSVLVSNPYAALQCAESGLGPTLIATWMCRTALAERRLVDVFPRHEVTATTFDTGDWLIYPAATQLTSRARIVADFLADNIRGRDQT
jgi:DNA-binding transcriptional LysR family regulator